MTRDDWDDLKALGMTGMTRDDLGSLRMNTDD